MHTVLVVYVSFTLILHIHVQCVRVHVCMFVSDACVHMYCTSIFVHCNFEQTVDLRVPHTPVYMYMYTYDGIKYCKYRIVRKLGQTQLIRETLI